jgi:predicted amidophosphoribosyltransferase
LVVASKTNSNTVTAACTFCDARIRSGESICPDCMKKYNIKSYNMGSDGCGCDS